MGVESLCCQVTILDKRVEEGVKRGEEAGAATSSITTSPDEETFKAGCTHTSVLGLYKSDGHTVEQRVLNEL
jgi:hypothetical protein